MLRRNRPWHEPEPPAWRKAIKGLLVAVVGIGAPLALAVWITTAFTPRPDDPPPPPTLAPARVDGVTGSPEGSWLLDADRSWVGYRIAERIPRLRDDFDAVGRTTPVAGRLRFLDGGIDEAWVQADLRDLESDNDRRDRAIRRRFLESDEYPDARFDADATGPLLGTPAPGEVVELRLDGALTLRGTTRPVRATLRARWDGDALRVVGTVPVTLDDFGIRAPVLPGFRIVEEHGEVEVDLRFVREG